MSDAIAFGGLIYLIAAGLIIAAIWVFGSTTDEH